MTTQHKHYLLIGIYKEDSPQNEYYQLPLAIFTSKELAEDYVIQSTIGNTRRKCYEFIKTSLLYNCYDYTICELQVDPL